MLKIKIPFGFKTLQFDNLLCMYTGKIRVKMDHDELRQMLAHVDGLTFVEGRRNCTTISYITTDYVLHISRMRAINLVLADIMHKRINVKYGLETAVYTDFDDLPF